MIKRQRREGTEMGDVERGGRDCWFGVGDEKEGGYERRRQPFILKVRVDHSEPFLAPWHPQDSGGCQVGGGHLEGKK